MGVTAGAGA